MLCQDSTVRHSNSKIEETPLLFSGPFGHFWLRLYHMASFSRPSREQHEPWGGD